MIGVPMGFVGGTALLLGVVAATLIRLEPGLGQPVPPSPPSTAELRPVSAFAAISDARARAVALFREAGKVFQHPRCVNCHVDGDHPLQTDHMQPHQPPVVRGTEGHGVPGLRCSACHGAANFDPARSPGATHWLLAPTSMALEGRSLGQICEQINDPARNGNRTIDAVLDHAISDSLIIWAWSPGLGRTPPPGTHAAFVALMQAWVDAGAYCPPP
jgi:hypothetical protein